MSLSPVSNRPLDLTPGTITNLGVCWVCDSTDTLEAHHCIPRCYGGEWGPQVVICAVCHGAVHKIADSKQPAVDAPILLNQRANEVLTRALRLATIILQARALVKDDPNKTVMFMDRFPAKTKQELRQLAKLLQKSQQLVVRHAIAHLYRRHFG